MMCLNFREWRIVLEKKLSEGQEATVLQLPAQPTTAAEVDAQKRIAYVDRQSGGLSKAWIKVKNPKGSGQPCGQRRERPRCGTAEECDELRSY